MEGWLLNNERCKMRKEATVLQLGYHSFIALTGGGKTWELSVTLVDVISGCPYQNFERDLLNTSHKLYSFWTYKTETKTNLTGGIWRLRYKPERKCKAFGCKIVVYFKSSSLTSRTCVVQRWMVGWLWFVNQKSRTVTLPDYRPPKTGENNISERNFEPENPQTLI